MFFLHALANLISAGWPPTGVIDTSVEPPSCALLPFLIAFRKIKICVFYAQKKTLKNEKISSIFDIFRSCELKWPSISEIDGFNEPPFSPEHNDVICSHFGSEGEWNLRFLWMCVKIQCRRGVVVSALASYGDGRGSKPQKIKFFYFFFSWLYRLRTYII